VTVTTPKRMKRRAKRGKSKFLLKNERFLEIHGEK
jgi:hypothetical protein